MTDTATEGQGQGGGAPAAFDWKATLGDQYGTYEPTIQAKGWKSPADALQSYQQIERTIGADKIALPGKDAKPEDWDPVWNKLGRPERPDGYAFRRPDDYPEALWSEERAQHFAEIAHKAGLSKRQAEALVAAELATARELHQQATTRAEADRAEMDRALRAEFGQAYDQKVELAKRAFRSFAPDGVASEALEAVLGHGAVVSMFARIGATMGEDQLHGRGGSGFKLSPEEARARRAERQRDPAFLKAFTDKAAPGHAEAVREMDALAQMIAAGQ